MRERAAPDTCSVAELVGGQQIADALHGDGRVEEPEPPRSTVLLLSSSRQAKPDARAEVVLVAVDEGVGQADLVGC